MEPIGSIDYWYYLMTSPAKASKDESIIKRMVRVLNTEYPKLCSLILERACNLNCVHCFFQPEKSSTPTSRQANLDKKILNIVSQIPKNSSLIHEGRILRDWHVPILKQARNLRSDISLGLIDNGSFVATTESLRNHNFLFNWIDISIDGTKEVHNLQRQNPGAFKLALDGLKRAKEFIVPRDTGGKITSLFTASKINYDNLSATAQLLMSGQLIDELHVTPASPVISKNSGGVVMSGKEWLIFWQQFKQAREIGKKYKVGVYLRLYKLEDVIKLSRTVGEKVFFSAFHDRRSVLVDTGNISWTIEDVRVAYIPLSICPSETFVIDADGKYRLAYSIQYSLAELNSGYDSRGNDITAYTVGETNLNSNFKHLYRQGVAQWMKNFGDKELEKEKKFFHLTE